MLTARHNQGFTLIELLVVMAISMVLMGLILGPVVQSFNLMRRAQAMTDAQDSAREAMQSISRELGQAMYVYDNASVPVTLFSSGMTVLMPYTDPKTPIMLPVQMPGGTIQGFVLPHAKIDFVLPEMTMHCNNPAHGTESRDYERWVVQDGERYYLAWPPCPVCESTEVEARPNLPLQQSDTIVRYFLALKDNDPSSPAFGWRSPWDRDTPAGEGNQVVLYRAEFSVYDDRLFPPGMPTDDRLSDPIFFYRNESWQRWRHISRVIGMGKYEDLVIPTYNDAGQVTAIEPTITWRTTAVNNDTFAGTYTTDRTFEFPNAVPTVFRSTHGYWTPDSKVVVYRDDYNVPYSTGIDGGDYIVSKWVRENGDWTEKPEFNITKYLQVGQITPDTIMGDPPLEMAFTIDPNKGEVNFELQPQTYDGQLTSPVSVLEPATINQQYREFYQANRIARRYAVLATFDDTKASQYLANAWIVPGSEQVIGPDMTPGSQPGNMIRYQRVPLTLGDAGLNQYKIDYKRGLIFFSPVWDQDLPETGDPIEVYYKVQFNRPDDVVRGDYSTKSLVSVQMQMRMHDPESGKPHPVELNDNIMVRNALR